MKKLLIVLFAGLGLLAGCGSGKPAIAVSASSSASTVEAGATAKITATLSNDSSGKGVTWSVTCSAASCGSISPKSSTTSPYTTTYTAPSAPPSSDLKVTITATSVSNSSKSGSVTVTVPAITVSVSPSTPQTVDAGSTKAFTATVANDPASGGVSWKVSCNTASCGKVSSTTTASGTAMTYSAPSAPPASDLVVTLTATSVSDGTKSASATITVPAVTVSVSPSAATVEAGKKQSFTATVSNSSNTGVTWVLACSPTCGTLSSTSSNPVTYTAPATPPSSNLTVTLTAKSNADATKSASATITVPAITVSVSPKTATVVATQTAQLTATVANDPASGGVNWTVSCSSAPCGSLSAASTASGVATTYTAPALPSSNLTVTVTATSATDGTKSASATITVPAISVTVAPPSPSVVVSGTENFTATVSGDPTTAGVTWTLTQSSSSCSPTCGSLSGATTTAVTYTAPATVPSPATVTLTATSVTDGTKTAVATITITAVAACGSGSEGLLTGHYAFMLKGHDSSNNPALVIGDITADGKGNISAGLMDMNLNSGVLTGKSVTGSYSIGSDHRGCMTLTVSGGSPATQDYRFSLGGISGTPAVASTGHMIDFDAGGPFTTGLIRQQDTTAFSTSSLAGNFAFGGCSLQNGSAGGGKVGIVGVWTLSGASGAVTGGELDVNKNGLLDQNVSNTTWPASPISVDSGGTYLVNSTGRGDLSYTPHGAASAVDTAIYVINANEFFFMSTGDQTANMITAGTAMKQSGSFSKASLDGTSVYYTSSISSTSGATRAQIGELTAAGSAGTFTISSYANDAGNFTSETGSTGTFTVDSMGRTLFSGSGAGNHPPVVYLATANEGFLIGGNTGVDSGYVQPQTGGPSFSAASVNGTYAFGVINPAATSASDTSGVATFDGVSAVTATSDKNSSGSLTGDGTNNSTYKIDPTTGLGQMNSNCVFTTYSTTCQSLFLVISPTKVVLIDTGSTDTSPSVQPAEQ